MQSLVRPLVSSLKRSLKSGPQKDGPAALTAFITNWDTTSSSETITLPATGVNDFTVDWGDGSAIEAVTTASPSHVYASAGNYDITIEGTCPKWRFANAGDKLKIKDVSQWGSVGFIDLNRAFTGCSNMTTSASDAGGFSAVTNMEYMFYGASSANPDVSNWDVSSVANMVFMFNGASSANPDVSNWDVSSVANMYGMFYGASVANPDVSNWNVSSVINMSYMFYNAGLSNTNYDKLLSAWSLQTLQLNVPFHAGTAKYTETAARAVLTSSPNNWTITDGGAL